MAYKDLQPGKNPPTDVNALIEISRGGGAVKYELDRESGFLVVDRLRGTFMPYPENYGCIPNTLGEDGDPLDILVLSHEPIQTGTVIPARPIGVLRMRDEKGIDHKIIAVPADRLTSVFQSVQGVDDLPRTQKDALEFHFTHYKALEGATGRFSQTAGWGDVAEAHEVIKQAIKRQTDSKAAGRAPGPKP